MSKFNNDLTFGDFLNMSDVEKEYVYNNESLFMHMLNNSLSKGLINESQLNSLLLSAGFEKNGDSWLRDSRTDFSKWLHEDVGPVLSAIGTYGTGAAAVGTILGSSAGSAASSSSQSERSQSWISTLLDKFSGIGSSFSSSLSGLGLQLGNSWLNMRNMEQLIDKQNAYNTPSAQMQRFSDAGLNPNLIYGLGSNGNQPASGSIAPVDFDTSQRENRLAKMQIDTQTKLAEADIRQKMSAANFSDKQAQGQELSNQLEAATLNDKIASAHANLLLMTEDLSKRQFEVKTQEEAYNLMKQVQQSQIYANMMSGVSPFGRLFDDVEGRIKHILENITDRFPALKPYMDFIIKYSGADLPMSSVPLFPNN